MVVELSVERTQYCTVGGEQCVGPPPLFKDARSSLTKMDSFTPLSNYLSFLDNMVTLLSTKSKKVDFNLEMSTCFLKCKSPQFFFSALILVRSFPHPAPTNELH